jgi:formylglycine-generating enzyme required for sulfatase activity
MKMTIRSAAIGVAVCGLSLAAGPALGNNVAVTNTTLKTPVAGKVLVQFDLSWDNSWRDGVNHDACWVFVKYSTDAGTNWSHATLGGNGTNPAGFSTGTGTGLEIVVPADKNGAFIQRSGAGTGTVANTGVRLVWDFATNGVTKFQSARVKVFAVEMVYVAEGSFYVGDGTTTTIQGQFEAGTNGTPFLVTNETYAITLGGGGAGSLGNNNATGMTTPDDFNDGGSKQLTNALFPKGYAAFYLMKTEISQGQYRDFLNTLTRPQQVTRTASQAADWFALGSNAAIQCRNGIRCPSVIPGAPTSIVFGCDGNTNKVFNETDDAEWVACNYISWADGAAYADWAALRPMTELEFEKACRGTLAAVTNEYAWGNANLEAATTSLGATNTAAEAPNQGNCNYLGCSPDGPYRVGSYADASSARTNAGAGYYGALDLSGSLWERPVTVGHATGRLFTGLHGDGGLDASGNANVTAWPGTDAIGSGYRGGDWSHASVYARVSSRSHAAYVNPVGNITIGWRGARVAP